MAKKTKQKQCAGWLDPGTPETHRLCEMFWTLGPAFSRWTESCLERGKSPQRLRLMAYLYKHGPSKMADLRDELGVTAASVTALVDTLERDGLVSRTAHKTDRRATLLKLTRKSEKQLDAFCAPFTGQVAEIFGEFSLAQQRGFLQHLLRLHHALVARGVLKACGK